MWLFKSDPDEYGYDDLEREKKTTWTGVRSNAALLFLRQVKKGDEILIYHSGGEKQIVGLAEAVKSAYPDPGENDPKLVVVDLKATRRLKQPVPLAKIKADGAFADFQLVRISRLSVMPVPPPLWRKLLELSGGH